MKIKWLLNPTTLLTFLAVGMIAYTGLQFIEIDEKPFSGDRIVVVDMLKVEMAQRKYVANILKRDVGIGGIASAFKASGDIVEASKAVAPGYNVAVKQAFLYSSYPDITNKVISAMGLPSVTDEETQRMLDSEETLGSLSLGNLGGDALAIDDTEPTTSRFKMPY